MAEDINKVMKSDSSPEYRICKINKLFAWLSVMLVMIHTTGSKNIGKVRVWAFNLPKRVRREFKS